MMRNLPGENFTNPDSKLCQPKSFADVQKPVKPETKSQSPEVGVDLEQQLMNFNDRIKSYVSARLSNAYPTEWEDVALEAMGRAGLGLKNFDGRSSLKTWVFQITRNTIVDFLRQHKNDLLDKAIRQELYSGARYEKEAMELADPIERVETPLLQSEKYIYLNQALSQLSEVDRELIRLNIFQGLGPSEISKINGRTELSVRARLFKIRQGLKAKILELEADSTVRGREFLQNKKEQEAIIKPGRGHRFGNKSKKR